MMLYTLSVAGISLSDAESDAEYLITKAGGLCGKNPFSTEHGLALDTVGREFFELLLDWECTHCCKDTLLCTHHINRINAASMMSAVAWDLKPGMGRMPPPNELLNDPKR